MIKPGTLCIITYTCPEARNYLGRFCTVVSRIHVDELGHNNMIDIDGYITRGADKCLMPISDGQDKTHTAEKKRVAA